VRSHKFGLQKNPSQISVTARHATKPSSIGPCSGIYAYFMALDWGWLLWLGCAVDV
jgi:hypothetical protein